ncbi:DUF930 domain-containing protein [Xanthobacter sp. TB0139]|uniref:DUF930 domain-containing protein n=1 Tax=Xanthobacter sp. TB0139 TaxID=3459178 RepID=UPI00403A37A1
MKTPFPPSLTTARMALMLGTTVAFGGLCGTAALAAPRPDPMILRLSPSERVEQRCNAEAMGEISRKHRNMRPDSLVAYAFSDPKMSEASINAPGAAVRSRGRWYHLSYSCETSADGTAVRHFAYHLGNPIEDTELEGTPVPH